MTRRAWYLLTVLGIVLTAWAFQPRSWRARLDAMTACYAEAMQLMPRWQIGTRYETLGEHMLAVTYTVPTYYDAIITYDTLALAADLDDDPRSIVVHELTHIWLWRQMQLTETVAWGAGHELNEQAATLIGRWPVWKQLCKE